MTTANNRLPQPRAVTLPVNVFVPAAVNSGDVISSQHENQGLQAMRDLWTNVQYLAAQTGGGGGGGGGIVSVFGRTTPAIVAQAGDYSAAMVTNAVSVTGSYADPVWLTSLGWGKLAGVPTSFPPAAHTHDASAIISGVIATARLGTGTANNTTFLRGDGTWATGAGGGSGMADPTIATGDLIVRATTGTTRLPVGVNGYVLTADSAQATGIRWAPATGGGGGIVSVFGRTDAAIIAQAGDYNVAQITGAVATTRQITTGAGLTGGGDLSADRVISGVPFGASGPSHATGMVPDPGATLSGTRFLREDATWAIPAGQGGGLTDPTTTRGDLIVRDAAATTRLGVGPDGYVLIADSGQSTGLRWGAAATGGVTSVFGRPGPAILAAVGDYTAAMVTNAVSTEGSYADPAWITSLAWSKISGITGTPGSTVFLRGDGTWAAPPGGGGTGSQTPWESDINANSFGLNMVKNIGIGLNALAGFPITIWADVNTAHAIYVVSHGCGGHGFFQQESDPTKAASFGLANDGGSSAGFFVGGSNYPIPFYQNNGVLSCTGDFVTFANSLRFFTNSLERMQITTAGAVNVFNALIVDMAGFNSGASADILFGGGAGVSGEGIGSNRVNYLANQWGLDFYTNNQARVHISNGGWVGIGMIPTTNLAVAGNINITGAYLVNGTPLSSVPSAISTGPPATSSIGNNQLVFFWNQNGPALDFWYRNSAGQLYQGAITNVGPMAG